MLVQLVNYNSLVNNSAVNTITDQQNIVQLASNLLEEENTPTWLFLEEVCDVFFSYLKHWSSYFLAFVADLRDNVLGRVAEK